jgi:hypothetical protein
MVTYIPKVKSKVIMERMIRARRLITIGLLLLIIEDIKIKK